MRHGSLFSGIGGFDLAAEWMGWENIFHCEWNPFGQRVLKHHFPKSISYEDITKTDFSIHRGTIDILTGGFPCQPYSTAGKRLGKNDERHLFPEMLRAIREIKPRWVVGENVRGLVSWNGGLVFDEVQLDLEAEGYEVQPFLLPAAGVNAPHKRDRVWFVAKDTMCSGFLHRESIEERTEIRQQRDTCAGSCNRIYREEGDYVAYSNDQRGSGEFRYVSEENGEISKWNEDTKLSNSSESNASNANGKMLEHRNGEGKTTGSAKQKERTESFGVPRNWETFPTKPPVCGGDDGLPRELDGITFPKWRNESIKAYGNAIVPQVALQIFKAIKEYEK